MTAKRVVADMQKILSTANAAAESARLALKTLEQDLPQVTDKTKATLDNARDATSNVKQSTADVQQIIREARKTCHPPCAQPARPRKMPLRSLRA